MSSRSTTKLKVDGTGRRVAVTPYAPPRAPGCRDGFEHLYSSSPGVPVAAIAGKGVSPVPKPRGGAGRGD
jgi:hypothetical protein